MLSHLFKNRSRRSGACGPVLSSGEGFTLLEMMVVIAIITVMTGILLGNLPSFRDSTTLQLVAQDVAVTIRQAQVFGIGTKVQINASGAAVFPGHGMYFCNPSNNAGQCSNSFILFTDTNAPRPVNKYFDAATILSVSNDWTDDCDNDANGECREVYGIPKNIEICDLKQKLGASISSADQLSITFSRLYPDAFIYTSTPSSPPQRLDAGYVYLRSKKEKKTRIVTVYNTGAITVTPIPVSGDLVSSNCSS